MAANIYPKVHMQSKVDERPLTRIEARNERGEIILTVNGTTMIRLDASDAASVANKVLDCLQTGTLVDAVLGRIHFRGFRDGEFVKLLFSALGEDLRQLDWIRLNEAQTRSLFTELRNLLRTLSKPEADS